MGLLFFVGGLENENHAAAIAAWSASQLDSMPWCVH